jgi:acyl-CoA reductase-like NAD-dependent aldehyde dehydrogenase
VRALVGRARAAQAGWAALPLRERARLLRRFRARLVERAEEVADTSCAETGKLPVEALLVDVLATAGVAAWSADRAAAVLGPRRIPTGWLITKRAYEVREPYGVVGVIAPWNWPVLNAMRAVLPALVAGNAVILKPSEATPFSALLMRRLADEAGIPADVLLIATGDGTTGAALVEAGVDLVSFTGSIETGRRIARAAAERLLPVSLELGGKDAMIVLPGADLARAASAAVAGALYNAGQICTSLERFYVEQSVYDEFVALVLREVQRLRVGAGPDADVGAITVPAQLETVEAQVRDAVARGARVLAGGRRLDGPGLFYAPTVLVDVTDDMAVMQEETFGPLLPIVKVADAAEAIRRTNASRFGLGASIWGPRELAESLVRRVRAGMLSVNDALLSALVPGLPFGGVGESGTGRVHGDDGLREMSWSRAVIVDRAGLHEAAFYPLARLGREGALGAVRLLAGHGALRWQGLRALLRRLPYLRGP